MVGHAFTEARMGGEPRRACHYGRPANSSRNRHAPRHRTRFRPDRVLSGRQHVARIRAFAPDRVRVLHEPDLLAPPRYVADHVGHPRERTPEQAQRWAALLREADVMFDFDRTGAAELPSTAPRLRWVQATSSGIGEFLQRTGLDRSASRLRPRPASTPARSPNSRCSGCFTSFATCRTCRAAKAPATGSATRSRGSTGSGCWSWG